MKFSISWTLIAVLGALLHSSAARAEQVLVEAESFAHHGGWKLDTQSIRLIGSPYLIAHGLGQPVENATTVVKVPTAGTYRVFVRTKDWVARWQAPGQPGRFQLLVNGQPLPETFGTQGADWFWHDGGEIQLNRGNNDLELADLTGFDGRCDAILFTTADQPPPNDSEILPSWRRELLGLPAEPVEAGDYDLVVIGGGYAGMGAALGAARMGCRVALIQERPVLGGNGSSEVRVWSQGLIRRGKFPRVGEIIEEFCDHAKKSPGTYEEFGDAQKEQIVRAEQNIDLYLNHHAYEVDVEDQRITAVYALDTRTSRRTRFSGRLFSDCTGHAVIGFLAGGDWEMTPKGRMGMSNMWAWDEADQPKSFPETPWALDLNMEDFPYPRDHHGQWFWEGGFDKDPIAEAEAIRDWNLRAVFGAFNAMKNRDGAPKHRNAYLTWIAYIGGPRESRRLLGDVILSQDDVVAKKDFTDGCVPSTWSIDLHYPKKQYVKKYPDNPFIAVAVHDRRVDRQFGYPVPYRCFYSRNIGNLFMAGRCISVTHQALGTVRVMKTCGMMGEVVGRAASVCVERDCSPRDVYERYWPELAKLLELPGKAHRETVDDPIVIPDDALPLPTVKAFVESVPLSKLAGLVIDNGAAKKSGSWQQGTGVAGYIGSDYVYASDDASIRFDFKAPAAGRYEIRLAYGPHPNRGDRVPATIQIGDQKKTVLVNMRKMPPLKHGFISLGNFDLDRDDTGSVEMSTHGAGGFVHADAVQVLPVR